MSSPSDDVHRDVLPIPDLPYANELPLDAKDPDASFPAIEPLQPPAGAPNVLVVLLDDADETANVGRDTASPVSDDYDGESSVFTGTVSWVQIDLGEDAEDADHLITPEERLRVAMARQ